MELKVEVEPRRILCYFDGFEASRPHSGKVGIFGIHSTLKLWGADYILSESIEKFQHKLIEIKEKGIVCLIVLDKISPEIVSILENAKNTYDVMLVTDEKVPLAESQQKLSRVVSHYLNISQSHLATTSLISAVKKTISRDVFGPEKYLGYGTPIHYFSLSRSEERIWLVDFLIDFVSGLDGVIPSGALEFARKAGDVLDELLMNAIWDANPARNNKERDVPVFLKPHEAVKVSWGVDGNLLAVSVTDPFGTLQREDMELYQDEVLGQIQGKIVKVNRKGPGAGIGLHMVLRRVTGLIINLNPGVSTEFLALFDLTHSPRYLSKGPKTFHFFSV